MWAGKKKKKEEEGNARQRERRVLRPRGCGEGPRESRVVSCGIGREFRVASNLR